MNIRVGMDRPLTLLLYYPEEAQTAITCAGKLRQTQEDTELLCMDADKNVDDYRGLCRRNGMCPSFVTIRMDILWQRP